MPEIGNEKTLFCKKKRSNIILALAILLLFLGGLLLLQYKPFEETAAAQKKSLTEEEVLLAAANKEIQPPKEYKKAVNLLLMGIDDRSSGFGGRTDTIIVATIDFSSGSIRLTSILRDTYLSIPDYGYGKINAAYTKGGPPLLIRTLKYNFHIDIDHYAVIDFNGFEQVIDHLGGIDMEIQPYEIDELNLCMINTPQYFIQDSGLQHLNGTQALAYSRIRHVGNSDFERVERQRRVLTQVAEKIRGTGLGDGAGLIQTLFPYIKSDASIANLLAYGYRFYQMDGLDISTLTLPANGEFQSGVINGQSVILPDLPDTALRFHQFSTPGIETEGLVVPDNSSLFPLLN